MSEKSSIYTSDGRKVTNTRLLVDKEGSIEDGGAFK